MKAVLDKIKKEISSKVKGSVFVRLENDYLFIHIYFKEGKHFSTMFHISPEKPLALSCTRMYSQAVLREVEFKILSDFFLE